MQFVPILMVTFSASVKVVSSEMALPAHVSSQQGDLRMGVFLSFIFIYLFIYLPIKRIKNGNSVKSEIIQRNRS